MVKKKYQSKRKTLRLKYNIQKRAKSHRKKMAKFAKEHPHLVGIKKSKKDPGVPNLWPFKQELLEKAQKHKEDLEEEKKKEKAKRKAELSKKKIAEKEKVFEQKQSRKKDADEGPYNSNAIQMQKDATRRRWYVRELRKVLETSDVILEVLDARDPLGCRCPNIEKLIQGKLSENAARPKRIILILNKIDLVPPEALSGWIKYLRREFPTIAFKASTQQQGIIGHADVSVANLSGGQASRSTCIGGAALLTLLKQYCLNLNLKTSINVGIIGYPNVGKSSIINSLKRARAAGVGANPGFTKNVQTIKLDKNLNLLDSPGVLFSAQDDESDLVLRNCLKIDEISDPTDAVSKILARCAHEHLMQMYEIGMFTQLDEFLYQVAVKRCKLGKGGVPDMRAAARLVLRDWTQGKIFYFTAPPEVKEDEHSSVAIVNAWGKAFDIEKLLSDSNAEALNSLKTAKKLNFVQMKRDAMATDLDVSEVPAGDNDDDEKHPDQDDIDVEGEQGNGNNDVDVEENEDEAEDGEEEEEEAEDESEMPSKKTEEKQIQIGKQPKKAAATKKANPTPLNDPDNPQINRKIKLDLKKQKKQQSKQQKKALQSKMDKEDGEETVDPNAYDFNTDWVDS